VGKDEGREIGEGSGFFFYALVYNVGAAKADNIKKERKNHDKRANTGESEDRLRNEGQN